MLTVCPEMKFEGFGIVAVDQRSAPGASTAVTPPDIDVNNNIASFFWCCSWGLGRRRHPADQRMPPRAAVRQSIPPHRFDHLVLIRLAVSSRPNCIRRVALTALIAELAYLASSDVHTLTRPSEPAVTTSPFGNTLTAQTV